MLDRLEREEEERDAMKDLEKKTLDAKTEMAIADALDEVRTRNAQRERADVEGALTGVTVEQRDEEAERMEREIEEQARLAFQSGTGEKVRRLGKEEIEDQDAGGILKKAKEMAAMPPPPAPTFQRQVKKKKDFSAALGIKKKPALL